MTSSEPLRAMLVQYEQITKELNESIDRRTTALNELAVSKAEVDKNTHRLNLIKEQVMSEKLLLRAGQNL